ncbi:hypothetical protein SASPL_104304 [Salvia splendens]|uniref:Uncharacterized protein n=1 Tax=Salvia splendens TaxID=180675 RepID=A0A8X9AAI8_SALSN|nr:hypothetical protein SASPL_104304 [Salvia splendens]
MATVTFVQRKSEIWHAAADATNVGQGFPHALVVVVTNMNQSMHVAKCWAVNLAAQADGDYIDDPEAPGSKDPEASHKYMGQHYEVAEILRIDGRCGLRERADSAHVGADIQDGGRDILTRNRASAVLNQNSAAVGRDQVYKVPNWGFPLGVCVRVVLVLVVGVRRGAWLLPCAHAQPIGSLIGRAKHEYTSMLWLLN